jgi:hypothetical protein
MERGEYGVIFQVKIVIMIVNLLDSVGVRRHDAHDQTITQRTISNHAAAAERMMHRDQICKDLAVAAD